MKRALIVGILSLFVIQGICLCFFLSSCTKNDSLPEGARTIEGSYSTNRIGTDIGYIFTTDGFGYQLIGEEVYQIKYYILGNTITVENFSVDPGITTTFTFYEGDGFVRINGIKYDIFVPTDDTSDAFESSEEPSVS